MASTISEDDFLRLQTQLIELKAGNYTLEERCRKQHAELVNFQHRCSVLENDYQKAQKAIAKSKKIKEVELLLQEKETLQLKLQTQEDEFRLQNTTMMEELTSVLMTNENLEKDIKVLRSGPIQKDSGEIDEKLQSEVWRLQAENFVLKTNLTSAQQTHEKEMDGLRKTLRDIMTDNESFSQIPDRDDGSSVNAVAQNEKDDYEVVEVGDTEVSYRKASGSASMLELLKEMESKTGELERQLKQSQNLQLELATEREEKKLIKEQLAGLQRSTQEKVTLLQDEVAKLADKLKKKQDSLVLLQSEKEDMYSLNMRSTESLQRSKDQEIDQLKDLTQRLQTQLNNTLQNFQLQKDESARAIQELEAIIFNLKKDIDNQSADKLKELEADRIVLHSQLVEAKTSLEASQSDSVNLKDQLKTALLSCERLTAQVEALEAEKVSLNESLENSTKTAEKRKALLDEMAIRLQTKTDNHQSEVVNLSEKYMRQIDMYSRQLEEEKSRSSELEVYKSKVEDMETEIKSLECTRGWFERRLTEAEESLDSTRKHCDALVARLRAEHEAMLAKAGEEHCGAVRDLETQLEISNAQKAEYEEAIIVLKQEIKDNLEDRKIHDKKGASIIKDLKRQLLNEKKRAESMQDKLQEFLNDSNQSRSDLFKASEIDKAETCSISSWSMMSGGGQSENKEAKDEGNTSLQNGNSPIPGNIFEQDNEVLLKRITEVQKKNWILEERLSHLEESSGAMAEDLVRKTAIIQYYCMEGRPEPHSHSPADKLTVKKLVDFIKDKGDENLKEVVRKTHRMLEEMLTKNMHLEKDLEAMSQECVRLSKLTNVPPTAVSGGY